MGIVQSFVPNYSRLFGKKQQLEGEYRAAAYELPFAVILVVLCVTTHDCSTNVTTHSEAIAAYNGAELERSIVSERFTRLCEHIYDLTNKQWSSGMLQDFWWVVRCACAASL